MASNDTYSGNIVMLSLPAWGHLRPLCALAYRIVLASPDVTITILMAGDLNTRLEGELGRYFSPSETDTRARTKIRIINLGGQGIDPFPLTPVIFAAFPRFYAKLLNGEPIQCHATGKVFEGLGRPNGVILDLFLLDVLRSIRAATGKSVPVFAWVSVYASAFLRILGPERFGGCGGVPAAARIEADKTGRKYDDVIDELFHPTAETVINVPGMPPMYEYEMYSQEFTPEIPQNALWDAGISFLEECDGVVSVSSEVFEPLSIAAMRSWFGDKKLPIYALGPLLPPGFVDTGLSEVSKQREIDVARNGREIYDFLDRMHQTHGDRSVIYVSFGSLWWPKRNEHVWLFVDVLLELGFPFILSHGSPLAVVPPGYEDKVKQSGIGLLTTWSPQQTVLNHPATAWILSHCGQNSMTEAVARGIPVIAWPLDAEQPINAAYLTLGLDIAFEMLEVRTGYGLKPLYRGAHPTGTLEAVEAEARDVLQRARGPEGERKRKNAERIRGLWKAEWEEGGSALRDLRQFLSDNCGECK